MLLTCSRFTDNADLESRKTLKPLRNSLLYAAGSTAVSLEYKKYRTPESRCFVSAVWLILQLKIIIFNLNIILV